MLKELNPDIINIIFNYYKEWEEIIIISDICKLIITTKPRYYFNARNVLGDINFLEMLNYKFLKYLDCLDVKIKEIPKKLIHLQKLQCSFTEVEEIPKELTHLQILNCS